MKAKQEQFEKHGRSAKPNFDILRIFAEKQDELDELIEAIKGHWKIRDYTVLGAAIPVPTAKISGWKSYRKFRIPTLKSERTKLSHQNEPLRDRRLKRPKECPSFRWSVVQVMVLQSLLMFRRVKTRDTDCQIAMGLPVRKVLLPYPSFKEI